MKYLKLLFVIFASSITVLALSPVPGANITEPSLADTWASSDQVVYGKIVALTLKEDSEQERHYEVRIRIEKTWKGRLEKYKEVVEMHSLGDGFGYNYTLGSYYVIFINATPTESNRNRAFKTELKSKGLFGTPWLNMRTEDGHTNEEVEALIEFLSKKPEIKEPNQSLQTTTRTVTPAASHPSRQQASDKWLISD